MKKIIFSLLISCIATSLSAATSSINWDTLDGPYLAESAEPGKSYFLHKYNDDQDVDIEYVAGNLPIIISVPHGGDKTPREISSRSGGIFSGNTTATDVYTVQLAYQIRDTIFEQTGKYPHLIICRLDRSKVDMNRDKDSRWAQHSRVRTAWNDFHAFIDLAKQASIEQTMIGDDQSSGLGFYIDLHGQPGSRTMIGNAITGSNLNKSDSHINGMVSASSFEDIFNRFNNSDGSFAELIRGEYSMGALIEKYGVPIAGNDLLCVPSPSKPNPGGTFYSGHYNLRRHTHLLDEFKNQYPQISGIQLECSTEVRKDHPEAFSSALTFSLIEFFAKFRP